MTDTPYLKLWRSGVYQPRWEPGPKLRDAGLKGRALKDDAGQWLTPDAARAEAIRLNAEAARLITEGRRHAQGPRRHPRCVAALWETYRLSPKFTKLAPATRAGYANRADIIIDRFGDVPVAALEHEHLYTWWEQLYAKRGHAMANGVLAVLRLLLSYAKRKGWRRDNPARELGLESVEPRVMIWLPDECKQFVATADAMGHVEIADAFVIALHTSQRLGDVLNLVPERTEGGRARFRQSKTGARVTVPLTDQLAARLEAARRRHSTGTVVALASSQPIVRRADGREHDRFSFNKAFREVRAAVADKLDAERAAQGLNEPSPVRMREFRDLRDTAITRLAEAGCNIQEIAAITGHSLETVHQVMKHYLALSEQMAIRGIDKVKAWMQEEGIAV